MKTDLTVCVRLVLLMLVGLVAWPVCAAQLSCEEAREKLIAPLREAKIKECKSNPKNKPDECERYYSTYGDATARPGGGVNPRMFDDIPECQQADKK
jgi:hypothetical protein